ncbi:MAG: protein kinase [Okeania sp. SIO2H7]|nr:protein kinase [Okeania sp. SIO2H7]
MIQPGLLLQNRYLVKRHLGRGGFAQTWEVEDRGTRKVLKVLHNNHQKAIELFQQEAEVLKTLKHPGIPKVEEDGYFTLQPEGHSQPLHCLVMEFIKGQDLKEWLEQQSKPITQEQALEWLRQLLDILEQVHAQNYFHRDIKPSNIMRKEDGQLVLIDFGTARELTETYAPKVERGDVTKIFSVGYTAPEQQEGKAVPESDLFALGRTFICLLTGKSIFDFSEESKTGKLLWRDSAPQISRPLADLIDALMEPLPQKRPKAQEILQRLSMLSIKFSAAPILSSLPGLLKFWVERILDNEFQQWFEQMRTPKIALYGRAGSGKSSLINAIMGRQVAPVNVDTIGTINHDSYECSRNGWKLNFIDSRGADDADGEVAFKQAIDYIVKEKVDILLFVIPVDERNVSGDFKFLEALKAAHKRKYGAELPVILVLNKIDRLTPREWNPPYNLNLDFISVNNSETNPKHQAKEEKIRKCIKARTEEYQSLIDRYVPVCALWDEHDDERYNVEVLVCDIYNHIPDEAAKHGFGGATADKRLKEAVSNRLTSATAWCTFWVVLLPNFDSNTAILQKRLVTTIAQLADSNQDQTIAAENLLTKLNVENNNPWTALTSTFALGKAAIDYFIHNKEIVQVQQTYTKEEERLEPEFQEAFNKGNQNVFNKLRQIDAELHERYGVKRIYDDNDDNNLMPVVPPQAD